MVGSSFVAISDREGFVGAFASRADARAALRLFPAGGPFVCTEWPRARGENESAEGAEDEVEDVVWVVPYKANDVVAFASDSQAAAERAQRMLAELGLVYTDSVTYWESAVGAVTPAAARRLAAAGRPAGPAADAQDAEAVARFLDFADRDAEGAPPARIDLLEFVVPARPPPGASRG